MKKIKIIYLVLLLLVIQTAVFAQYNVGNGDGFSNGNYSQADNPYLAIYSVGNDDGFSFSCHSQADNPYLTIYSVGNGDGFSNYCYSQTDNPYLAIYSVGNGDGFSGLAKSSATAYFWNVASGNWSSSSSWLPARTSPLNSDILIFDGLQQAFPAVNLDFDTAETIGRISFINSINPDFTNSGTQTLSTNQTAANGSFVGLGIENSTTTAFNVDETSMADFTSVSNFTLLLPTNTDALNISYGSTIIFPNTNQITGNAGTGSVTVKGSYITSDIDGFSGTAGSSVSNSVLSVNLDTASTVEYIASGDQVVSARTDYQHIVFSGSGTKTLAGNIDVNNTLSIFGSAVLAAGTGNISIKGDWINNSTDPASFNAGSQTVTFNGTTNIGGTAITTFYDVIINVSKTLNIPAQKAVTIDNNFTNNGTVLINGAPNGYSGSLITNGTITGTGTCSFKTVISGNMWHNISSPVTNAQIENVFSDLASHNNNFYWYNEANATGFWVQQTTGAMNPGQGYNTYYLSNKFKTYSGVYNSGNIVVNLTYSAGGRQGWNFVGNPYPSAIDWKAATGWTRDNVDNTICIKNNQNWAFYNHFTDIGINGGTQYIYPGQGFFVKAATATMLSMTNAVRVHRPEDYLLKSTGIISKLRFKILSDSLTNESVFMLYDESHIGYDPQTDAYIMHSENEFIPELAYISTPGDSLIMEAIPVVSLPVTIPLHVKATTMGINTIQLTSIEDFPDSVSVYIEDTQNGYLQDLKNNMTFNFNIGTSGNQPERFNLILGIQGATSLHANLNSEIQVGNPYISKNHLYIPHKNIKDHFQLSIFSVDGKEIISFNYSIDDNIISVVLPPFLTNGLYLLSLSYRENSFNRKFILIR